MKKYVSIELDFDQVCSIVANRLAIDIDSVQGDIEFVRETEKGLVFHTDMNKDIKKLEKLRKAMKLVRTYYALPSELK